MRFRLIVGMLGLATVGFAQTPDVAVFADLRPTFFFAENQQPVFRWYDFSGRPSLVGFRLLFENGNRVYVGQRLSRFPGSGDPDSVDEYYLEDTGRWRIGKQLLPFGTRNIVRETALAARFDTRLIFDDVPIQIAVCDGGPGRVRGVVGRIGRRWGVSFAAGNNFVIQSTSMTMFRGIEAGLGAGRGYDVAVGVDFEAHVGSGRILGEWVSLRNGKTPADETRDLSDIRAVYLIPDTPNVISLGWARSWDKALDSFRIEGEFFVDDKVTWLPYLRLTRDRRGEIGISTRIKL